MGCLNLTPATVILGAIELLAGVGFVLLGAMYNYQYSGVPYILHGIPRILLGLACMLVIWIPTNFKLRLALTITYSVLVCSLMMLFLYFGVGTLIMELSYSCEDLMTHHCDYYRVKYYFIMATIIIFTSLFYTMFGQVLFAGTTQVKAQNFKLQPRPNAIDVAGPQIYPVAAEKEINAI